jgi:quinol monooxygenase YgiN
VSHGPEGPERLLEALRSVVGSTLAQAGCRSCRVFQEADEARSLLLLEEWDAPEDLERHFRSAAFRRVLSVLELSHGSPEVRFVRSAAIQGPEWIASVVNPPPAGGWP